MLNLKNLNIMKNIHVLPTDRPSRIYLVKSTKLLGITSDNPWAMENFGNGIQNQNAYITNDEPIKEGDWFYDNDGELCKYISDYNADPNNWEYNNKIILTTDSDLIKDGVQVIDDGFLEWFCSKNGKVDFVEVIEIEDEKNK
jgi:hypothetical protein